MNRKTRQKGKGDSTLDELICKTEKLLKLSVKDFGDDDFQMSIVHGVTALEMILKARLWRVNRGLVLEDLDGRRRPGKTVSLSWIPKRLENCNMALEKEECDLIGQLIDYRNDVVHFILSGPRNLRALALEMFDFVAKLLNDHFGRDMRSKVPTVRGATFRAIIADLAKKKKVARVAAKSEGIVVPLACPICRVRGGVCLRATTHYDAYCHYCKNNLRYQACGYCKKMMLSNDVSDYRLIHERCSSKQYEGYEPDFEPYWK